MFFDTLERVRRIGKRHAGRRFTPEAFTKLLRSQFRDPQLTFHTRRNKDVEKGNFWISGEYYPAEDRDGLPCIKLHLTYPSKQRYTYVDQTPWDDIAFHIADVLTHEYLHQYYIRQRGFEFGRGYKQPGFRMSNYQESIREYLGCEDELLCHAFNVASESIVYDRDIEQTRVYRLYKKHFRQDLKTVLKLRRQAVKYIKRLEHYHEQDNSNNRRTKSRRSL